jgi:serine/threonine protein kinase
MAPEILLKSESYDEKVDVWSAGVIFYELLTGKYFLFLCIILNIY